MMTFSDTITRLDSWVVPVPLARAHVMSFGSVPDATQVLVRASSASGVCGWGETTILGGPFWNEESVESVQAVLTNYIGPRLIGLNLDDAGNIAKVLGSIRRNHFARSAIDIALHDLQARVAEVPLSVLLGGTPAMTLPVSWSLANGDLGADLDELAEKLEAGHHIIKVKTGSLSVDEDISRVEAICEQAGPGVSVRIDANQGWTRAEAGRAVRALESWGLAFIEQPLVKADIEGMRRLQATTSVPLAADESLETLDEASRLIAGDSARVFVLKLAKHAGYRNALAVSNLAAGNGIESYLGCMIESSIGTAASLALAAAAPPLAYGCELFGPTLLAEDLVEEPITLTNGMISLPSGPGLGVEVDLAAVDRLASSHTAIE